MSCLIVGQRATVREHLCNYCATRIPTVYHADVRPSRALTMERLADFDLPTRRPETANSLFVAGQRARTAERHRTFRYRVSGRNVASRLGPCTLWTEGPHEVEPWNRWELRLRENEMERSERENIMKALETTHGKIYLADAAAAILGMKPTTLASRMKKMKFGKP